jgi:signal transduction histidine kinase/CheY-like chemotaxis protein/putative methionine-R-sulfoxide reductase with GAF domain
MSERGLLHDAAEIARLRKANAELEEKLAARTRESREALEQQTATAEILGAISRAPSDPGPVFETIITNAARLCEAQFAMVMLNVDGRFELAAHTPCTHVFADFLKRGRLGFDFGWVPDRARTTGRAALERRSVQVLDIQAEPGIVAPAHCIEGVRTVLAVPMCSDDELLGVFSIWRHEVRPFTEDQVRLLETFACQAVIAIENVRLFQALQERNHDLADALGQQTATSEILRVISSSPTDLKPVFETIVTSAARLCEAHFAFVMLNEDGRLNLAARTECTPEFAAFLKGGKPPNRATTTGRAALERKPVQVLDFLSEPEAVITEAHRIENVRTVLAVPMCRGNDLLGVFSVWRREVRPFTEDQIRLLETFASQAVIAIENVRLFRALQERNHDLADALGQQTATSEILRVISSSHTDALPVFETIVRNAVALCGSVFANVFRYDGELLHYVASHNTGTDYVELLQSKYPMRPDMSQVSGRVMLNKSIVRIEDVRLDPDYDQRFPVAIGWRRMLGVPMLREGQPLGAIIVGWAESGPIPKAQEDLLRTFADQAVIALENVRLFDEIQDKSRQLELANTYKSRFLAAASHDLRQPLHALNLFVEQLQAETDAGERKRLVGRVDAAIQAMNELFNALLDVSRLDAGVLEPNLTTFPVEQLLARVESTFSETAREKGLRLSVVPSGTWARSDFILLERILFNLVSNAVRYTTRGGIVVGCRRSGECLRLEVYDSGPGIPENQQQHIFREFYQVTPAEQDRRGGLGLGLGLAIVERLGQLLDHPVDVASRTGKGSRFSVTIPRVRERYGPAEVSTLPESIADPVQGKVVVVIDDDALVLDGMCGTLRGWGCRVVAAESDVAALSKLRAQGQLPDAIISDFRLAGGQTGIQAIERLCGALGAAVPAFLVSGDTAPDRLREASAHGYLLLHKPVPPMALRAVLNRILKDRGTAVASARRTEPRPTRRPASDRNPLRVPR